MSKQTKHIMVDIETLSTAHNTVVLSIAAVGFDPISGHANEELYHELRLDQQQDRKVDTGTVCWWVKQISEDVTKANIFINGHKTPVRNALVLLKDFFERWVGFDSDLAVWACDPDFDLAILADMYQMYNMTPPWKYYNGKSVRTVRLLAKELGIPSLEAEKTHNALEDCHRQIKEVVHFYKSVGVKC